jgi:hypothetical protein
LIINTEAFSPKGLDKKLIVGKNAKGKNTKRSVMFTDLPWVVQRFFSVYPKTFAVLDESSKIKTNTPMDENDKSIRTRLIKLVGKYAVHKCIMTGTLM